MKALINNHNMFGDEFNDEQVKMIYDNQKRALLEGFEHDHLFEDQRVTVVEYGRTAIRFGLMRGNQRAYVYLAMGDYIDMPRYRYQVVMNAPEYGCEEMGYVPLYVTDDKQFAQDIIDASIEFARKTAGDEMADFNKNLYSIREVA